MSRPHFLFVCDHGIRDGDLDVVALLPWFADRPGWWAAKGVHESAVKVFPMEGNQRGHDPKWLVANWIDQAEPDPRRDAIEIKCAKCTVWAYRSDDAKLQTLLTRITAEPIRSAVTVSADADLIVMKLQALHTARKYLT